MTTRLLLKASSHWPRNSKEWRAKEPLVQRRGTTDPQREIRPLHHWPWTTGYEWIPTHIPPSQPDTRMRHFNLYHAWRTLDHSQIIHPKHQRSCFKNASTSELRDAISTLKTEPDTSAMFSANWTRKNKTPYHMHFPNCRDVKKKCSPISRKDWALLKYPNYYFSASIQYRLTGSAWWKNWRPKTLQNLSTRGRAYSENICHSSGQLQTSNFSIFSVWKGRKST